MISRFNIENYTPNQIATALWEFFDENGRLPYAQDISPWNNLQWISIRRSVERHYRVTTTQFMESRIHLSQYYEENKTWTLDDIKKRWKQESNEAAEDFMRDNEDVSMSAFQKRKVEKGLYASDIFNGCVRFIQAQKRLPDETKESDRVAGFHPLHVTFAIQSDKVTYNVPGVTGEGVTCLNDFMRAHGIARDTGQGQGPDNSLEPADPLPALVRV